MTDSRNPSIVHVFGHGLQDVLVLSAARPCGPPRSSPADCTGGPRGSQPTRSEVSRRRGERRRRLGGEMSSRAGCGRCSRPRRSRRLGRPTRLLWIMGAAAPTAAARREAPRCRATAAQPSRAAAAARARSLALLAAVHVDAAADVRRVGGHARRARASPSCRTSSRSTILRARLPLTPPPSPRAAAPPLGACAPPSCCAAIAARPTPSAHRARSRRPRRRARRGEERRGERRSTAWWPRAIDGRARRWRRASRSRRTTSAEVCARSRRPRALPADRSPSAAAR